MKSDLVVLSGGQVGRIVELGARTVIGRTPTAQLCLVGALVSKTHCELRVIDEELWIYDMDSTNGILLNGERVTEARAGHGDILDVGGIALLLRLHDAPPREASHTSCNRPTQRLPAVMLEGVEQEAYYALQMVNILDLGRVLARTTDPALLVSILEAKVQSALQASRCVHLVIDTSGSTPEVFASQGGEVGDLRVSADDLAAALCAKRPTTSWENGAVIGLLAPMPAIVSTDGEGVLYVERSSAGAPFTAFERSVLAAIAVGLESAVRTGTREWKQPTRHWQAP